MTNESKTVRINIRNTVNSKKIRRERRNGRDKIIVPSATLPDDIIMNGIKYPADEIEKSFKSLENKPAPLGHPMLNGEFVSASDPEGINVGWVGAHNENVRRENGRVFLDKVIDIARAKENEGGRNLLQAIENGDAIHTSTGLFCNLEDADADDHEHIASNIYFDHDAILLGEEGAATPAQGVGIFVNSKGKSEKVEVLNMTYDQELDEQIAWSAHHLATAIDRKSRLPAISEITDAIFKAIGYKGATNSKTEAHKENDPMADNDQLDAINKEVGEIKTAVNGIADAVSKAVGDAVSEAMKPMIDAQNAEAEARQNAAEAERKGYVETIVKANMLSQESADALPLAAAKEMAANAKKPKAANLVNAFGGQGGDEDEFAGYDMNANIDAATGVKKEA